MATIEQLVLRQNPVNGLEQILYGPHHIAWLNTGGRISPLHEPQPDWDIILQDVTLVPGGPSLFTYCHVMPLAVEVPGAKHKLDINQDDRGIQLTVESTDPNGYFHTLARTLVEPDPDRTGQLRLRYNVEWDLLKDLDAADILQGKMPDPVIPYLRDIPGVGPAWIFEFCDPWLDSVRGPAVTFDRDYACLDPYAGQNAYTRRWKKRWDIYAFEAADGSIKRFDLAFENLIRNPARFTQFIKPGGRGGFFLSDQGNPVTSFESNERVAVGLCQWIYDAHYYAVIPMHAPRDLWNRADRFNDFTLTLDQVAGDQAVLKAGRKITFAVGTVVYSRDAGSKFIARAESIDLEPHERHFYEGLPALTAGTNDFITPVSALPDANAWVPASIAVWDKTVGYNKPGSLRITNQGIIAEGAWSALGGRSSFCEPIIAGVTYSLRGRIKTINALGEGASLEVHITEYKNRERSDQATVVHRFETPKIRTTVHWAPVQIIIGPLPENCMYVQLVARLKGKGTAWFDEIRFEPVQKEGNS